jgi:glycosyltransferase involved in cell wall biosynthesis
VLEGDRIALVSRSYFPDDPRLARQAAALLGAGASVEVICMRRPNAGESALELVDGVTVRRLGGTRARGSRVRYVIEYGSFFAAAAATLAREHVKRRFGLVQVANPPDALVGCGLLQRLGGARLVLDIHDLSPELYASKFGRGDYPFGARVLELVERAATRLAHHVFVAGEPFRDRLVERGLSPSRVTSIPNGPDEQLFEPRLRDRLDPGRLVYHGSLFDRYDVALALEAFPRIRSQRSDARLDVWGEGPELEPLRRRAEQTGLQDSVAFHPPAPLRDIPSLVANAACGLSTLRSDCFTELAFPTKVAEYAQLGVPVAASRTLALTRVFPDDAIAYYPPGDAERLAEAVLLLLDDPARAAAQAERAQGAVGRMLWSRHAGRYLEVVEKLLARRRQ